MDVHITIILPTMYSSFGSKVRLFICVQNSRIEGQNPKEGYHIRLPSNERFLLAYSSVASQSPHLFFSSANEREMEENDVQLSDIVHDL